MGAKEVFAHALVVHEARVALEFAFAFDAGAHPIGHSRAGIAAGAAMLGIGVGVDAFAIAGGLGGETSMLARALSAARAAACSALARLACARAFGAAGAGADEKRQNKGACQIKP